MNYWSLSLKGCFQTVSTLTYHCGVVCKTDNTSFIFPINKNFTVSLNHCSLKSKVNAHLGPVHGIDDCLCRAMLSHSVIFHSYNPWTVASQASLSMGILQTRIVECVARPSSRDLPNPGIKSRSATLQVDSLASVLSTLVVNQGPESHLPHP